MSTDKQNRPSLPVLSLTALGVMITILGLFVGGNIAMAAVGLGAIFGAGLIGVAERLADARHRTTSSARDEEHT